MPGLLRYLFHKKRPDAPALAGARAGLKRELRLLQDQLALYKQHIEALQDSIVEVMRQIPEAACLTSIPGGPRSPRPCFSVPWATCGPTGPRARC